MASATLSERADADVRVGEILSRSFGIWQRVILPFGLIYCIATLPSVVQQYELRVHRITAGAAIWQWIGIATLLGFVVSPFVRAGVASLGLDVVNGVEPSVAKSLNVAMRAFPRMLALEFLVWVGVVLAFVLLIVPGFILISMWFVAVPCCVGERLGPIAGLKRSASLTKGYRWKMFGLLLIAGLAGMVGALLVYPATRLAGPLVGALVQLATGAATGVFFDALAVAAYTGLRAAKEGASTHRLAHVF